MSLLVFHSMEQDEKGSSPVSGHLKECPSDPSDHCTVQMMTMQQTLRLGASDKHSREMKGKYKVTC